MCGEDETNRWLKPLTPPETMYAMFAHLDSKYGGVRAYLQRVGMTEQEPERIWGRLRWPENLL